MFPGVIIGPLLEDKQQGLFDPTKFVYLGSADSGTRVCITYQTSKIKTFEDAQKNKVIIGASAAGGGAAAAGYESSPCATVPSARGPCVCE